VANAKKSDPSAQQNLERLSDDVARGLDGLRDTDDTEVIVAVPFHDENDTLPGVVQTARKGLEQLGLAGRSLVICVGPAENEPLLREALDKCHPDFGVTVHGFVHSHGLEGHGWSVRAIMEAASKFGTPLIILPPNIVPQSSESDEPGRGFSPQWIAKLIAPVRDQGQALALGRFNHHPFAFPVDSLLVYPILTEVFSFRIRQPAPGVKALSLKLVRNCLSAEESWPDECGVYGVDPWLVTRAFVQGFSICEVPLGLVAFRHAEGRLKLVFRQLVHNLMRQVAAYDSDWLDQSVPIINVGSAAAPPEDIAPPIRELEPRELYRQFKREFDHFDDTLLRDILPDDFRQRMERLADEQPGGITLDARTWVKVVNRFLFAYRFESGFHPDDIVDALFPFFLARLSSFVEETNAIREMLGDGQMQEYETALIFEGVAEYVIERQTNLFVAERDAFRESWRERESETKPYLPKLGAWEFVPHVGVMLPQELETPDGGHVWASHVYRELIDRYRREFTDFLRDHLDLDHVTDSATILTRLHDFMLQLDRVLDSEVFHCDLTKLESALEMTQKVCDKVIQRPSFQLTPEASRDVLSHAPPPNLIMQLRCKDVASLVERYDPPDALAMAAWTERRFYLQQVLDLIEKRGDPSWFHIAPTKPVVVNVNYMFHPAELRSITPLARLSGRVVSSNLQKGWGGEYPKLWYLLRLIQAAVGVECHSEIWKRFAEDERDFSQSLVQSIRRHWGRHVLSAHNVFENWQQRMVVEWLKSFADGLDRKPRKESEAARLLHAAASVYHLSITLPDATFVPLSAWTWTSYSYRGGLGSPTPLSSLVERDWATMDFLTQYIIKAGLGDREMVYRTVEKMIGQGREPEDLSHELLGLSKDSALFVIPQTPTARAVTAGKLVRQADGPILEPVAHHPWESRYVLNAGAIRVDGTIYIIYRAFGDDKISRLGMAWTNDGVHIDGRLDDPIYEPADATESAGCEDPRITVVDDKIYMLYTAWDQKVAQIAMSSIPVDAFLERRFDAWTRHGLGFPGLANKDAALYPEKFDGNYILYHRIDPNMWISYLDGLRCPWPRTGQKIVVGPRPGMMWDGLKIGAGAQPIKTTHGWLNIYHGVDYEKTYRLGVLFMALDDPSRVIYQSPNAILEPERDFEIGKTGGQDYWVPHVVFTCGAVPAGDTDTVGLDDEILVYYGAADTVIAVAKGSLRDLVPVLRDDRLPPDSSVAGR
jgi:predicted GH43/DUF377 family glycosyl hydrolase